MEIKTYRVKRPLKMGDGIREPGELAPEMNAYLRVDNFVHTGYLAEVWVSGKDFEAAVNQYCPADAEKLFAQEHYVPEVTEEPAPPVAVKKTAPQIRSNK